MQIYFHSRLCSYLSRVPILVEGTVYIYIYISAVKVNALTQIHFNGTNFINAARIFCLTRGLTRSWRNGDA